MHSGVTIVPTYWVAVTRHVPGADPTGEKALAMAEAVRKNLRLLYRSGKMSKAEGFDQVEFLRQKLRQALHTPELLDELHNGSSG